MPTLSSLGYTDGAGKNIKTFSRSESGTTREEQVFQLGEQSLPTYTFAAQNVITTTSASHLAFLQGDGTLYTRVHWFEIEQQTLAGAAAIAEIRVYRTTTAGTGGTSISCFPADGGDTSPYAGVGMTLPTAKGTEGALLYQFRLPLLAAAPTATAVTSLRRWEQNVYEKPWIIAPATTNGLTWKLITGIATSTLNITIGFTTSIAL